MLLYLTKKVELGSFDSWLIYCKFPFALSETTKFLKYYVAGGNFLEQPWAKFQWPANKGV